MINEFLVKKIIIIVAILFILFAIISFLPFVESKSDNNYKIENKYYNFELTTPKNWLAFANGNYSENKIAEILKQCQEEYQDVGIFRFSDKRYDKNIIEEDVIEKSISTRGILEILIQCFPKKNEIEINQNNNDQSVKICEENTNVNYYNFKNFGKIKKTTFFCNGLIYEISEYVYVSSEDRDEELLIREKYSQLFSEIISSLKFKK